MVRRTVRGVNGDRAYPGCQVFRNEDVIAAVRRLAFLALVDAEGMGMCFAWVKDLPGVGEFRRPVDERLEEAAAQRVIRGHVEVATNESAFRMRQRRERTFGVLAYDLAIGLAMELA